MKKLLFQFDAITKGYKRHFGALVCILPQILIMFGLDKEVSDQLLDIVQKFGLAIYGAGWLDTLRK